ncbi:hypothetical protein [Ornithinibacillus halotolerans]|uniref:hypothetical protein n=1 Tax=Ornithinibacillus halotolerans TaxID=1274357 RepID=UPI0035712CB0
MFLKDFLDFWLREYKIGYTRKNSYSSLNNSIENHIKPYFKNSILIILRTRKN